MVAWLVLLAQDSGVMLDRARQMLSAQIRCPVEATTDVTVCGLRRADRYRVPSSSTIPATPHTRACPQSVNGCSTAPTRCRISVPSWSAAAWPG